MRKLHPAIFPLIVLALMPPAAGCAQTNFSAPGPVSLTPAQNEYPLTLHLEILKEPHLPAQIWPFMKTKPQLAPDPAERVRGL